MGVDNVTWLAMALMLTALGGIGTVWAFRSRGLASAVRWLAWTLLPMAAYATGTLKLAGEVADDVGRWAGRLVFNPLMWSGVILAGVAVVLFGVSGVLSRRGIGTGGRKAPVEGRAAGETGEVKAAKAPGKKTAAIGNDKDMDDIEAILRKHGIS